MLRDVLPGLAIGDGVDGRVSQSGMSRHRFVRHTCCTLLPNPPYDLLGGKGMGVVRTKAGAKVPSTATPSSLLPCLVGGVVGRRAEEQMIWPNAGRVVAGVADVQVIGDGSVVDLPRDAGSTSVPSILLDDSVAIGGSVACPLPAPVALGDEPPEAGGCGGRSRSHRNVAAIPRAVRRGCASLPGVRVPATLADVCERHGSIIPWTRALWTDEKIIERRAA